MITLVRISVLQKKSPKILNLGLSWINDKKCYFLMAVMRSILGRRVQSIKLSNNLNFITITESGINLSHISMLSNRIPHLEKSIKLISNNIIPMTTATAINKRGEGVFMKETMTIRIQKNLIKVMLSRINAQQNPGSIIKNLRNNATHQR